MKHVFTILFFMLFTLTSFGQREFKTDRSIFDNYTPQQLDSIKNSNETEITVELDGKTHYTDYKIISYDRATSSCHGNTYNLIFHKEEWLYFLYWYVE